MASEGDDSSNDLRLAEALERFEAALARGESVDIDEFCKTYPDIRDSLRKALSLGRQLAEIAGTLPGVRTAPRPETFEWN